jgi:L-lactate dehydrogenase complex protein LldG
LELVEQFIASAIETTASVERIPCNKESLNNTLSALTGNEMTLLAEPDDLGPELFSLFKLKKNVVTSPTNEQISNINIGVTDCFCGIAATGSVCVPVTKNLSSLISSITGKHIVVLDSKTIVPKPRDIFSDGYLNRKGLNRSFSIITGPSATADMGPLVRGVHGPGKLHIIILE